MGRRSRGMVLGRVGGGRGHGQCSNAEMRPRPRPNQLHVPPRRASRRFSSVDSRRYGCDTSDRLCRRPPSLLNAVNRSSLLSSPRLAGESWPVIVKRAGMRFCLLRNGH